LAYKSTSHVAKYGNENNNITEQRINHVTHVTDIPTVRIVGSGIYDCPNCGSTNMTPFNTANTSSGFSFFSACCGFILLGPLGVLCGLNDKIKTVNQTHWMCQVCGSQFRDPNELIMEKRANLMKGGITMNVIGAIALLIALFAQMDGANVWWLWLIGIGLVGAGIWLISKARDIMI